MAKKYSVTFSFHTYCTVEVEAENKDEALDLAYMEVDDDKYNLDLLRNMESDNSPSIYEKDGY